MLSHYLKAILGVYVMNKKQAVAYAQVTLDYMLSSKCDSEVTPEILGIEMKQCFKLYSRDIIVSIADAQMVARKELQNLS